MPFIKVPAEARPRYSSERTVVCAVLSWEKILERERETMARIHDSHQESLDPVSEFSGVISQTDHVTSPANVASPKSTETNEKRPKLLEKRPACTKSQECKDLECHKHKQNVVAGACTRLVSRMSSLLSHFAEDGGHVTNLMLTRIQGKTNLAVLFQCTRLRLLVVSIGMFSGSLLTAIFYFVYQVVYQAKCPLIGIDTCQLTSLSFFGYHVAITAAVYVVVMINLTATFGIAKSMKSLFLLTFFMVLDISLQIYMIYYPEVILGESPSANMMSIILTRFMYATSILLSCLLVCREVTEKYIRMSFKLMVPLMCCALYGYFFRFLSSIFHTSDEAFRILLTTSFPLLFAPAMFCSKKALLSVATANVEGKFFARNFPYMFLFQFHLLSACFPRVFSSSVGGFENEVLAAFLFGAMEYAACTTFYIRGALYSNFPLQKGSSYYC